MVRILLTNCQVSDATEPHAPLCVRFRIASLQKRSVNQSYFSFTIIAGEAYTNLYRVLGTESCPLIQQTKSDTMDNSGNKIVPHVSTRMRVFYLRKSWNLSSWGGKLQFEKCSQHHKRWTICWNPIQPSSQRWQAWLTSLHELTTKADIYWNYESHQNMIRLVTFASIRGRYSHTQTEKPTLHNKWKIKFSVLAVGMEIGLDVCAMSKLKL